MPVEFEYISDGIYVFHWLNVVHPKEVEKHQAEAIHHAKANGINESVQVIDMRDAQMVVWDIRAFRRVVEMNMDVVAILLVQPPRYMLFGARAIQSLVKSIEMETFDDYDEAVARAKVIMNELM